MKELKKNIKQNWKNYVIAILILLFIGSTFFQNSFVGYQSYSNDAYYGGVAMEKSIASDYYYRSDGFAPDVEERVVIKNANLQLETDSYDGTKAMILNKVNSIEGFILQENEYKYKDDYRSLSLSVKLQSGQLDAFITEVKSYGEVENLNVYTNDVTGTHTDYTERIQRYKDQIQKYVSMLSNEEISIEEEIQIQERIDNLENQIFYLESSKSSLEENAEYSSVYITLKEKPSVLNEIDFLGLRDSFKLFMQSLENAFRLVLMIFGFVLPFAIIYGLYRGFQKLRK